MSSSTDFILDAFIAGGIKPAQIAAKLDALASELTDHDALKKYFLFALCMRRIEVRAEIEAGIDDLREKRAAIFAAIDEIDRIGSDFITEEARGASDPKSKGGV